MMFSWTVQNMYLGNSPQSQLSGPRAGGPLEDSGCHLGWPCCTSDRDGEIGAPPPFLQGVLSRRAQGELPQAPYGLPQECEKVLALKRKTLRLCPDTALTTPLRCKFSVLLTSVGVLPVNE